MEIDIKCRYCQKRTLKVIFPTLYLFIKSEETRLFAPGSINCPKCKKDISNKGCLIKKNDFLLRVLTANVSKEAGLGIPTHLQGVNTINNGDFFVGNNNYSELGFLESRKEK